MATSTCAFFAGIGTTFVVLTIGFGGGLMLAKSALKEPGGYQTHAASEALAPIRVILPTSAEAAQPPQQQASSQKGPVIEPAVQPANQGEPLLEKQDARKLEAEERERKRRHAERKARRQAEARLRGQREQQQLRERLAPPIMAFSGESSPHFGRGLLGN
jgi:hypothetical protein